MSNCNGDASHEEIVNGYGENGDLEINNQENDNVDDNVDDTENENGKIIKNTRNSGKRLNHIMKQYFSWLLKMIRNFCIKYQ